MTADANDIVIHEVILETLGQLWPEPVDRAELAAVLSPWLERVPASPATPKVQIGQFTKITLTRQQDDPPGQYRGASRKFSNSRFLLGKMLTQRGIPEFVRRLSKLIKQWNQPWMPDPDPDILDGLCLASLAIQVIWAAKEVVDEAITIPLEPDDALVLAALYRFAREEAARHDDGSQFWDTVRERGYLLAVRRDAFLDYLTDRPDGALSEARTLAALERLDSMWALRYVDDDDEIHLIETIIFQSS